MPKVSPFLLSSIAFQNPTMTEPLLGTESYSLSVSEINQERFWNCAGRHVQTVADGGELASGLIFPSSVRLSCPSLVVLVLRVTEDRTALGGAGAPARQGSQVGWVSGGVTVSPSEWPARARRRTGSQTLLRHNKNQRPQGGGAGRTNQVAGDTFPCS